MSKSQKPKCEAVCYFFFNFRNKLLTPGGGMSEFLTFEDTESIFFLVFMGCKAPHDTTLTCRFYCFLILIFVLYIYLHFYFWWQTGLLPCGWRHLRIYSMMSSTMETSGLWTLITARQTQSLRMRGREAGRSTVTVPMESMCYCFFSKYI